MDNETVDITVSNQINPTTVDIEKDYKYTRGQLYSIIEKGQEAINGILVVDTSNEWGIEYLSLIHI